MRPTGLQVFGSGWARRCILKGPYLSTIVPESIDFSNVSASGLCGPLSNCVGCPSVIAFGRLSVLRVTQPVVVAYYMSIPSGVHGIPKTMSGLSD